MSATQLFALTGHVRRDMAAQVARLYALRIARKADLELDSIETWVHGQMSRDGGEEARNLAIETGLSLIETRGIVGSALRRYYVARRMAALPPAMRWHAIRCQNPTVRVLLGLMEAMDPEDRGGMDPIRATRRLFVLTQAQELIQRERAGMTTRPRRFQPR